MTLRDDLVATRALIDSPEKWLKEELSNGRGGFCIIGALTEINAPWRETKAALVAALPAAWNHGQYSLVPFNNARTTTHADIMALFDRAIKAAEASS